MFEPQDHPNDFPYPGGPPRPPYDSRRLDGRLPDGHPVRPDPRRFRRAVRGAHRPRPSRPRARSRPIRPRPPDSSSTTESTTRPSVTNRLLKAGGEVYWLKGAFQANGKTYPAGTIFIPNKPTVVPVLQKAAKDLGVAVEAADLKPAGESYRIKPVRIGVWDSYGGSMDSGWMHWLLDTVRISLRGRLRPGPRRGEPERQVRCPRLRRRGDPGLRLGRGHARRRRRRRRALRPISPPNSNRWSDGSRPTRRSRS